MADRILVSIFRRGAAAGQLEIVPNTSEAGVSFFDDYRTANRFPNAHVAAARCTPLAGQKGYAVNSDFTAFIDQWNHATFKSAAFLTVGNSNPTRSHFYEQDRIDGGGADFGLRGSGYLNRWAALVAPPAGPEPLDLLSIGTSGARSTIGSDHPYAATQAVTPPLLAPNVARASAFMAAAPGLSGAPTARASAQSVLNTNVSLSSLTIPASLPSDAEGAPKYPSGSVWATRLQTVAKLIIGGTPSRVICCDSYDWDHHENMGGSAGSPSGERTHASMFKTFNDGLKAFIYDLTQSGNLSRVTILTQTEFHRTMRENGAHGADHGYAGHAYIWGPAVTSGLYGAPLDYRENSSIYADAGAWQSPLNNRLLNFSLEYRELQRMVLEWLMGRYMTSAERSSVWGPFWISNPPADQRAALSA